MNNKDLTILELEKIGFPVLVKFNKNFLLDESFNKGTIVKLTGFKKETYPDHEIANVQLFAPKEYFEYNFRNEPPNWHDNNGEATLNIFEVFPENFKNGDFYDTIYVTTDEKCFDLYKPKHEDLNSDLHELSIKLEEANKALQQKLYDAQKALNHSINEREKLHYKIEVYDEFLYSLTKYFFVPKKKIFKFLNKILSCYTFILF